MKDKLFTGIAVGLIMLVLSGVASANTIDVTYTASGSAGSYVIDFTLANNIPASYGQGLYFFGVDIGGPISSPTGWSYSDWDNWNNIAYGGNSINYTSNWMGTALYSGNSLSGFEVSVTTLPATVHFFTYAGNGGKGGNYYEADAFYKGPNPGFEGSTNQSVPVPEPSTFLLLGAGLAGVGFLRRRTKKQV